MAFDYPLDIPTTPKLGSFTWGPGVAVVNSKSDYSQSNQSFDWGGDGWGVSFGPPDYMDADIAALWETFFMELRGPAGTFLLGDIRSPVARGNLAGTPVVDGADQQGNSIAFRGFTPSASDVIKRGDYFQLGTAGASRLYRSLEDVDADGSGNASFGIFPNLREAPADGAVPNFTNPKCVFKLTQDALQSMTSAPMLTSGLVFNAMESY